MTIFRTPFGDLSQNEVADLEAIHRKATEDINSCKDHLRQRCVCWKEAREALFEIRLAADEKSAFAKAAVAVWNAIERFARNRVELIINQDDELPPDNLQK